MTTSTDPFLTSQEKLKELLQTIQDEIIRQGVAMFRGAAHLAWQLFTPYLLYAIGILFLVLLYAVIKASLGRWGTLGSLLYHIFYFGILGIIVWITGFEIFFNGYFDMIAALLYPVCYFITGLLLERFRRYD